MLPIFVSKNLRNYWRNNMLSNNHSTIPYYRQRMSTKEWKKILLDSEDSRIFKGNIIKLCAKNLGYGVVEVFKDPKQLKKLGYNDYSNSSEEKLLK